MVTFSCAIVGVVGSVFPVEIHERETVEELKKLIKSKLSASIMCDANHLQLYMAKKDNFWLDRAGAAAVTLDDDGNLRGFDKMNPLLELTHDKHFKEYCIFDSRNIYVLVVVPNLEQLKTENLFNSFSIFREESIIQDTEAMSYFTSLPFNNSKFDSDVTVGQLEIQRLINMKMMIDVASVDDEEAFWSEEIQIQADVITKEADLDAFITPYLSNVLRSYGLVLVNSEGYQWLSQSPFAPSSKELLPKGFATHCGMYQALSAPNDRVKGMRYGVAEVELFDCLILFECKLSITDAAFGQVVRYLSNLCRSDSECRLDGKECAVLFDRHSFWLIESYKSAVFRVQKAKWVSKSSKMLFQKFITRNTSPWVTRLIEACSALGVKVEEGAFLGRGAYGLVFKVTGQDRRICALKIVEKCSVRRLRQEEKALMNAHHTGLTSRPMGNFVETSGGAALLLSPVGKTLLQLTTREEVREVFMLLWELHENGIVHGDAYVENVILAGGRLFWIDLEEVEASPALKQFDAEMLTRSILRVFSALWLDPLLKQLIGNYGKNATQGALNELAEAVYQLKLGTSSLMRKSI